MIIVAEASVTLAIVKNSTNIENNLQRLWNGASNQTRAELEKQFKCCGWNNTENKVKHCDYSQGLNYTQGCGEKLVSYFQNKLNILSILAIILASIEVIGAAFSIILYTCISCCSYEEEYPVDDGGEQFTTLKGNTDEDDGY